MMIRKVSLVLVALVVVAVAIAVFGTGGCADAKGKTFRVPINGYQYAPQDLVVSVGDTVVWTNGDDEAHTVTTFSPPKGKTLKDLEKGEKVADKRIESPLFAKGKEFQYTFKASGDYHYFCTTHIFMVGKVTVK